MNAPVPMVVQAERFVAEALDGKRLDILAKSMPDHIDADRFKRNLITAVANHPQLLDCAPHEVFHEAGKASALGFYLDPALGEAYLITGYNKKRGGRCPQLRIGYRGIIKLARQSGQIATIYAEAVHANDPFKASRGTAPVLFHEPDYMLEEADRGEVRAYYAVVVYKDGATDFEVMPLAAIHRIRDRSDGYKAFRAGTISSNPWDSDEGEMAKKTVLRRLGKRLPLSPEVAQAFAIEDADYISDEPAPKRLSVIEKLAARNLQTGSAGQGFSVGHVTREADSLSGTAESDVIEGETVGGGNDIKHGFSPCPACGAAQGVECAPTCASWDDFDPEGWPDHVRAARKAAKATEDQPVTEADELGAEPTVGQGTQEATPPADPTPSTAEAKRDTPPPGKTLKERAADYEARINARPPTTKLKGIYAAAAGLRTDLDRADPERLVELDDLFNRVFAEVDQAEKEEAR